MELFLSEWRSPERHSQLESSRRLAMLFRGDHQQAGGAAGEEMGIEEITILADDDRVLRKLRFINARQRRRGRQQTDWGR